ncbi:2,3-dihydroxybiphenyl 1,2-dioxygenase [Rhizobiales bacterium GAS188]|nr:2,3-dihydroxybiphenyl 1,2-dioxygenase [Rhizobiales bacterium GAS188]
MEIQAFGYLGVGSDKVEDWSAFAPAWLGMQEVDRGGGTRAFRMDDRKQRLFVDRAIAPGTQVFGWEVASAAALDALAARLEKAGVAVKREPAALADQRCVAGLISFADPAGNRLEAFHGAMIADTPFKPARDIAGFRTGAQGMGHALLAVQDIEAARAFYCELLGFKVSDYMRTPIAAYFLHVNGRHHSIAIVGAPGNGMHHLLVEFFSLDDVGQGYDMVRAEPERIAAKLGRHPNDLMLSYYMRTPGDILVECGWGGREVDDATWQPEEMTSVGSMWGHQGLFEALGGPEMPVQTQRHAPVQVIDGNYEKMTGVCPWWDAMRRN